ncbi:MAG TPA: hypothetical protein VGZ93_07810 [Candidatus Methylacidiphilales bacterium]|nr:hypothetical protein [Candidatus Methylacidiphilales bacterium]
MIIALASPLLFMGSFSSSYHPNLSSLLEVQNLFFVGIIATMVIAPEKLQFGGATTVWNSGTEFLLTRAIDRPLHYRSKAVFLYVLILLAPLAGIIYSTKNPDLKVTEYSQSAQQLCLSHVPGSTLERDPGGSSSPLIVIPRGNILIEEWHLWMFLVALFAVQALILVLYPFKHRLWIFWGLLFSSIFVPLFIDLADIREQTPPHMESLFFLFAAHQAAFWILTALTLILGQLWCERRFARLEQ